MPEIQPRENPTGADNEQGSPTETDLAWLAGIFDGEGWIGINRAVRKSTGLHRYSAGSAMASTSDRIADRVCAILDAADVRYFKGEIKPQTGSDGLRRRRKWNIQIVGNIQTTKLLCAVRPYLVEKGLQADLVLEYVQQRSELPSRPGGHNLAMNQKIRDLGARYQDLLRGDRNRNDPSTTTRSAPRYLIEKDRVRVMT